MGMKTKLKYIALSSLSLFSLGGVAIGTIAWFQTASSINYEYNIDGESLAAYFAYGDGSAEHPYGIRNTRHLNNLAWLQYNGNFNGSGEHYHFELADNINANGYCIPPIGTEDNPFVGVFNGKNYTITGLKISNNSSEFTTAPENISYSEADAEVVGFFGVVGNLSGASYSSSVNEIKNFTLNNFTVESTQNENTLIGLAAGYCNATMSGVKVGTSEIITNGQEHMTYTDNLSDYGLVGYVEEEFTDSEDAEEAYQQDISEFYNSEDEEGGGGEPGDNWGGSINMRSLNNRIWNLLNAPNNIRTDDPSVNHPTSTGNVNYSLVKNKTISGNGNYHRYYYDDYNYVSVANGAGETSYNNRNPETVSNIYRFTSAGTYSQATKDNTKYKDIEIPGTALPLTVGEKTDGYPVANGNTGYIVGGMAGGTGSYTGQTTIRVASSPIGSHIGNSLSSAGRDSTAYTASQLEVITTSNPGSYSTSNFSRIADEYNAENTSVASAMSSKYSTRGVQAADLAKYNNAREQLDEILTGQSFSHGLHFTGSSISTSTTFTMPSATINGNTYSNYDLPKNSIDFNLKKAGYINFFAGSYQHNTETACDSFFSLHVVKRNGSNGISSISEISKVYNNTNAATKVDFPYVYEFTNGENYAGMKNGTEVTFTKGSSIIFDMQYLWNAPSVNFALYYFEVPVNGGEFAMGSHSGKDKGTYLLYLDISASSAAPDDKVTAYSVTTYTESFQLFPTGVDFATSDLTSSVPGGETFGVVIHTEMTGTVNFDVSGTTITYSSDYSTDYAYIKKRATTSGQNTPPNEKLVINTSKGTRIITCHIIDGSDESITWDIIMSLNIQTGVYAYTSIVQGSTPKTENDLPQSFTDVLSDLKAKVDNPIVSLTRTSGTNTFNAVPTYSGDDHKTVSIAVTLTNVIISAHDKATGYTISINGTAMNTDPKTYPVT